MTVAELKFMVQDGNIAIKNNDTDTLKTLLKKWDVFKMEPYDLYNREFLGLKTSDSICAVAVPLENSIKFFLKNAKSLVVATDKAESLQVINNILKYRYFRPLEDTHFTGGDTYQDLELWALKYMDQNPDMFCPPVG